jgi:hypothetical protein
MQHFVVCILRDTRHTVKFTWQKLYILSGTELENHYKKTLEALKKLGGILGEIFTGV